MKLLIATTNLGKKRELIEAFETFGVEGVDVLGLDDVEVDGEPDENAETFEENARIKAAFFGRQTGIPTLGEDSGLRIEAFPEKFGVRTRREISAATDAEWMQKFLELMTGAPTRRATFFSATAVWDPATDTCVSFLGSTSGEILDAPQTDFDPGIPVSAVFVADGQTRVYSALTREEKNQISHRGKSVRQLAEFLKNYHG